MGQSNGPGESAQSHVMFNPVQDFILFTGTHSHGFHFNTELRRREASAASSKQRPRGEGAIEQPQMSRFSYDKLKM